MRITLVGTGHAAEHHLHVLRTVDESVTISVASRDAARAQAFAQRHGVTGRTFESYDAAMSADDDLLVLCTPPGSHADLLDRALEHGRNVLVEKPVVASLDELDRLWPRLASYEGFAMVAENQQFAPQNAALLAAIESTDLGRPILVEVRRTILSPQRTWRADPDEMPLGALHEAGVHWIRRLLVLTGAFAEDPDTDVTSVGAVRPRNAVTDTPGEETMLVTATHRSGAVSQLVHSWGIPNRTGLLDPSKVLCERGAIYFDLRARGGLVFRGHGPRPARIIRPTRRDRNGDGAMWRSVLAAVRAGAPAPLPMRTSYADFAYLDAAYRSVATGRFERPRLPPTT